MTKWSTWKKRELSGLYRLELRLSGKSLIGRVRNFAAWISYLLMIGMSYDIYYWFIVVTTINFIFHNLYDGLLYVFICRNPGFMLLWVQRFLSCSGCSERRLHLHPFKFSCTNLWTWGEQSICQVCKAYLFCKPYPSTARDRKYHQDSPLWFW